MDKLLYIYNRLQEPSSHNAIMFMFGIFQVPQVQVDNIFGVLTLVFGILGVFTKEGAPETRINGFSK